MAVLTQTEGSTILVKRITNYYPSTVLTMSVVGDDQVLYNGDSCNLLELTLEEINVSISPIRLCFLLCLFFTVLVFVLSEVSRNYSQTDKM